MDQKKKKILDTARSLFLGQGFKKTRMEEIARTAGVSKGAVYLHFESKQDIFYQILLDLDEQVWREVRKIVQQKETSAEQRLRRVMEVYYDFIHENRVLGELQLHEVGLSLTEEMLESAKSLRLRWQMEIEKSIIDFVGSEYEPWKSDLAFTLTGLMETLNAMLLVDRINLERRPLIDYLIVLVQTVAPELKRTKTGPLFDEAYQADRLQQTQQGEQARDAKVTGLIEKIEQTISSIQANAPATHHHSLTPEVFQLCEASLQLLKKELCADQPDKTVIHGMLANLKVITDLTLSIKELASLLEIDFLA